MKESKTGQENSLSEDARKQPCSLAVFQIHSGRSMVYSCVYWLGGGPWEGAVHEFELSVEHSRDSVSQNVTVSLGVEMNSSLLFQCVVKFDLNTPFRNI